MKTYVDGCSYTAADGLPKEYKLANLIDADCDMSFGGKSNLSIFKDVHMNLLNYDVFVINLTTANRFQLFDDGVYIPVLPNFNKCPRLKGTVFESIFSTFHKVLFTLHDSDYYAKVSDAIADSIISLLIQHDKKYVISSWEERKGIHSNKINLLKFDESLIIPNNGHLNEQGMSLWAQQVLRLLNE